MAANITLPDELLDRVRVAAEAEGKSLDEFAAEALQRQLVSKFLARNDREALLRRGNKTEEEIEEIVLGAIQEDRQQRRGR